MSDSPAPSAEFLSAFREEAGARATMAFERFMQLALYHPKVGYYRREQTRVGYAAGTDFFTATTSAPVFGELIAAACVTRLGRERATASTFFEIGAEPERSVLQGVHHPFRAVRVIRLDDPIEITGRCVVFSNELFDAQPFRRFIRRAGAWREIAVTLRDTRLVETETDAASPPAELPNDVPDGYVIDAPLAAAALAKRIASQPWTGLFVACDYGKSWRELIEACPAGTARAYYRHQQSNDLLARPGEQDLTCHVCWDWLSDALRSHGFVDPHVDSQEAFFIRQASEFIAATSTAEAARFSPRKLSLMQLLHPSHLGQKFQVLHALRD